MSDLLNLLDSTVDDLADLEKFTPVPAGTHKFQIEFKKTDSTEFLEIRMGLKVTETIEMKDSSQEPPEPGKETSQLFRLANADGSPIQGNNGKIMTFGQGQLKEVLLQLQPVFGGNTLQEVMDNANGGTVIAAVGIRPNKNDPDQLFNTIKAIVPDV